MNTKTQNNRKLPLIFKIFTLFLFHFPPILELTKEKEKKTFGLGELYFFGAWLKLF